MTNYDLNYYGEEYSWLFVLSLLAILQHVITAFLVRTDALKSTETSIHTVATMESSYPEFSRYVSYMQDHFYWFWNVFPIIFLRTLSILTTHGLAGCSISFCSMSTPR